MVGIITKQEALRDWSNYFIGYSYPAKEGDADMLRNFIQKNPPQVYEDFCKEKGYPIDKHAIKKTNEYRHDVLELSDKKNICPKYLKLWNKVHEFIAGKSIDSKFN